MTFESDSDRFIAAGSDGMVWRRQTASGPVVVKRFSPGSRRSFFREMRMLSRLKHSHIVPLVGFRDEGEILELELALCSGGSLRDRLNEPHDFQLGEVILLFRQMAEALVCLAEQELIHADVKPENILLLRRTGPPVWQLADFGLAMDLREGRTHRFCTLDYAPPEAKCGRRTATEDVYALGRVVEELLARIAEPAAEEEPLLARLKSLAAVMTSEDAAVRPDATILLERAEEAELEYRTLGRVFSEKSEDDDTFDFITG